jgi:transposase-like protein
MEIVRELERDGMPFDHVRRKYGIAGSWTVQKWVHKYGNGSRGKVMRVEKPQEINEKEQLKRRVRVLEEALADANIDLALERQYTRLACERAGIQDVAAFKKKADGQRSTEP